MAIRFLDGDVEWIFSSRVKNRGPVILAIQEAEIRRITVRSKPRQIVLEALSQKFPSQERAGGVAQGEGPEFKPQYHKKKEEEARSSWGR
jgi:hypothetical protein